MEAVNSRKASESNTFLGWLGLTSMSSIAIPLIVSSASGVDERSAPSPRPSPRLFMPENLPREFEISDSAAGAKVVEHHGLAMAWGLAEPNVPRDHRLEDFAREVTLHLVPHLQSEARPPIEHREHDPLDCEPWVQPLAHEFHRLEEVRQTFECIELALQRHQYAIRRRQGVDGQQPERWRTVNDDVAVGVEDRGQRVGKPMLASIESDQLDLSPDEVDVGRREAKVGQRGLVNGLLDRLGGDEYVVDSRMEPRLVDAETRRRVALGIQVDHESTSAGQRQPGGDVDGRCGLADAALLIHNGYYTCRQPLPFVFIDEHCTAHDNRVEVARPVHCDGFEAGVKHLAVSQRKLADDGREERDPLGSSLEQGERHP